MLFQTDAFTLSLLLIIAAGGIGIATALFREKARARHQQRNITTIKATIVDYFSKTGVSVSVDSACLGGNGRYTAVIESEPMKRFRLSHIIEMTLRDHVRKSCGLELDKVYWRFPVVTEPAQAGGTAAETGAVPATDADEYISEGLEHYKDIPKVEATELPWEQFEKVTTITREGKVAEIASQ
ncbi:MAG TPA: hypothetical protein VGU61_09610 [Noviherbaspirillum sp.]|jgi:hypothetical protein|uniref:hypothetical protein n=1 Tax=Noviherbaspirillum sp. TaxID=1926288 RepID=UPI002DDD43D2|nr:hypothetical protein [Noviherbaspirillum sp.]HEV2610511.1 hypothetical protein [Noviherbaspirillum sp.]